MCVYRLPLPDYTVGVGSGVANPTLGPTVVHFLHFFHLPPLILSLFLFLFLFLSLFLFLALSFIRPFLVLLLGSSGRQVKETGLTASSASKHLH